MEKWNFRRRVIREHEYIIAYKGDKEKSLGKFSNEKWEFLQELGAVMNETTYEANAGYALLKAKLYALKSDVEKLKQPL